MSIQNSKSSQITAAGFLNAALKAGVAALALSSGAAPANARRLTASGLLPNANSLYPNYTNDAAARGNCSAALSAATQNPVKADKHHTVLKGCRVAVTINPDGGFSCSSTIGKAKKGQVWFREGGKKAADKVGRNAATILTVLNCKDLQDAVKKELKNQGLDYKKNPEAYKKALSIAVVAKVKGRHLTIDGFSLVLEEGVAGAEKCLLPTSYPNNSQPRAVVLTNPATCEVKPLQPMLKTVDCGDICGDARNLIKPSKDVLFIGGSGGV